MRLSFFPVILSILVIQACVSSQKKLVDGLSVYGAGSANSVNYSKLGPGEVNFYSRIAGAESAPIPASAYQSLAVMPASWGELRLYALPDEAAMISSQLGLSGDSQTEEQSKWIEASVKAMGRSFAAMSSLSGRSIRVDLYLAPLRSGRELALRLPVTDTSLHVAFMHGVGERDSMEEWTDATTLVVHELLHIHYHLAGLSPDLLDNEVAAYLTGFCGEVLVGIEAGVRKHSIELHGLDGPVFLRVFPGLQEGVWDPNFDRFRKEFAIKEATAQGRMTSLALLYHRYASEGVIDKGSQGAALLLEDCSRLPQGPPRYSKGETEPPAPAMHAK